MTDEAQYRTRSAAFSTTIATVACFPMTWLPLISAGREHCFTCHVRVVDGGNEIISLT